VVAGDGTTVVVQPVPVAVVSGTDAAGQVVVVGSHAAGVVDDGVDVVVPGAAGHAVEDAPTQLTFGDAVSDAEACVSCPTGTVATASSVLLSKLVTCPPAD
jgi:hypothetical protein